MSFQTCMHLFLMLNIKENVLKNAGNQTADYPHSLPYISLPTMEVNGDQELFGIFKEYLFLPLGFEGQGLGVRRRGRGKTEKWDSP